MLKLDHRNSPYWRYGFRKSSDHIQAKSHASLLNMRGSIKSHVPLIGKLSWLSIGKHDVFGVTSSNYFGAIHSRNP
jgi:hypothetical protein